MRFQFNQNKARYETKELNQASYQANPEKMPLKLLCAPFHGGRVSHFKETGLNRLQSHQPRYFLDFLSSWYAFKKKVWAEWCERVKWERPNGGHRQDLPLTPFPFRHPPVVLVRYSVHILDLLGQCA